MLTFGFSAFLKLLSLSERSQRSEIRRRLKASGHAYDFHRSLRLRAHRLLAGVPLADVVASANTITRLPERLSAVAALTRLDTWRHDTAGTLFTYRPAAFESPSRRFKVKFEPDFGLQIRGAGTAFHIWNNKAPKLATGPTYAALHLIGEVYQGHDTMPDDIAVLSLREPPAVYRLGEVADMTDLAASITARLEDAIEEEGGTALPPPEERPHA